MYSNPEYSYKVSFYSMIFFFLLIIVIIATSCSKTIVNPGHPSDPIYSNYADPVPQKPGQSK